MTLAPRSLAINVHLHLFVKGPSSSSLCVLKKRSIQEQRCVMCDFPPIMRHNNTSPLKSLTIRRAAAVSGTRLLYTLLVRMTSCFEMWKI